MPVPRRPLLIGAALTAARTLLGRDHGARAADATPAAPARPEPDAFDDPPEDLPDAPGVLLRHEPLVGRALPDGARAWRILHTTRWPGGAVVAGVATLLVPDPLPAGPLPVIAWDHGTVGLRQRCLPSRFPAPFAGVPALPQVVAEGWAVVATDYAANGRDGIHPYLIGDGEAFSTVDAVRAARALPGLGLGNRVVLWGHSQGGQAALWTAALAPGTAPELEVLGVAALAPATDLARIFALLGGSPAADVTGAFATTAYAAFYDDVREENPVRPDARETVRRIADLCPLDQEDAEAIAALVASLGDAPIVADPAAGALGRRLRQNAPRLPIAAPVLVAQGQDDLVVPPWVTDVFAVDRCADGQSLAFWRVPGTDHAGIVAPGSPVEAPLVGWTRDRFAGVPVPAGCRFATLAEPGRLTAPPAEATGVAPASRAAHPSSIIARL